jgi:Lecithin retinol acyltransferase
MNTSSASDRPAALHSAPDADLPLGCQLVTPRRGFTHHGIYIGDGRVVHYAGLSRGWHRGPVEVVSLAAFANGREVRIVPRACTRFTGEQAVCRALARVGEDAYRIATNNCEHFCAWCIDGQSRSPQIERLAMRPWALARALFAALAQVLGPWPRVQLPSGAGRWRAAASAGAQWHL